MDVSNLPGRQTDVFLIIDGMDLAFMLELDAHGTELAVTRKPSVKMMHRSVNQNLEVWPVLVRSVEGLQGSSL